MANETEKKIVSRKQYMKDHKKKSQFQEVVRMYRKNILAVISLVVFICIVLACIFANVFFDYDKDAIKINARERLQTPSAKHLFGTDDLGRDVLARVLFGGRISLRIGFIATSIGATLGIILGATAGFYGGTLDMVIMRLLDVIGCVPSMLLAIAIVAAFGISERNLILAVGFPGITGYARGTRQLVLATSANEYVEAARALGQKDSYIIFRHVLINALGPMIVQITLGLGGGILSASGLSFLGLGIQAPVPEWGNMLASARAFMRDHMYLVLAPGMSIFVAIFCINNIGDGLRDALDPKLRK